MLTSANSSKKIQTHGSWSTRFSNPPRIHRPSVRDCLLATSWEEALIIFTDIGLQILDNVILTRWKVLPRDQCQGRLGETCGFGRQLIYCTRHSQFRRQLHHTMFEYRREPPPAAHTPQQAEYDLGQHLEDGVAAQLANLHQRDHIVLPLKHTHLREQHGDPATVVGRGV